MTASERYTRIERMAVGGMGEVFLARQHGVGGFSRTVVLKHLLPTDDVDGRAKDRLLDEARITGSLAHDNVVSIIEVGEDEGRPFLAFEYVHGENLNTLLKLAVRKNIPVPTVVIARIGIDAARGLHHAHSATGQGGAPLHIIHRDISPKNIFVRHDGTAKVGDFGIAAATDRLAHTATGAVTGTVAYMSPEQLQNKPLTAKTDLFSLGIVLWELICGERLFRGDGIVTLADAILRDPITPPHRIRKDIPREVSDLVMRLLDRDPSRRPRDAEEVAITLEQAIPEVSLAVGRAAVAAFVDELCGAALRTRMQRIDAPVDAGTPAVVVDEKATSDGATTVTPFDDRTLAANTIHTGAALSVPSSVQQRSTSMPAILAGAVVTVVVALALAMSQSTPKEPTPLDQVSLTRAYLKEARALRPLSFREVLVVEATAASTPADTAEKVAAELTELMKARLDNAVRYHDGDDARRLAERARFAEDDMGFVRATRPVLTAIEDGELRRGLFEMWFEDSASPVRFVEAPKLVDVQSAIFPAGIEHMKSTSASRWAQFSLMIARAGGDAQAARTALEPLVNKREALIERFGQAPEGELASLEKDIRDIAKGGAAALKGIVDDDAAVAAAFVAFIGLPDSEEPRAELQEAPRPPRAAPQQGPQ